MKHITVITTVGTSMFTNYFEKNENSTFKGGIWKTIRDKSFTKEEYERQSKKPPFQQLEKAVEEGLNNKFFSCAELDTINAIKKNYETENIEHHLLCSQTIAGVLAGKILKEKLGVKPENNQIIENLQTKIATGFKEKVFLDLVEKVQETAKNYEEKQNKFVKALNPLAGSKNQKDLDKKKDDLLLFLNETEFQELKSIDKTEASEMAKNYQESSNFKIVINYSGGYKAIIPYLTILGQLYNYDLAYMHEDGGELIDTKRLPFNFDVSLAERYYPYLTTFRLKDTKTNQSKSGISSKESITINYPDLVKKMLEYQLIYKDDNGQYSSTAFGEILWHYNSPLNFWITNKKKSVLI